ncbi:MAG: hypothetical protein JWO03_3429 [Bacteroidetes bacterium]|nr:hypothetical protein [Bacteroidota bacterium]
MKSAACITATIVIILCMASCSKENNKTSKSCNDSSNRVAIFDINNADSFVYYLTPRHFGDITKVSGYATNSSRSTMYLNIGIGHVCPYEDALVSSGFNTLFHDNNLKDTLAFREASISTFSAQSVPFDPNITSYHADEPLTFVVQSDTTGIAVVNAVYFPPQGSWQADSIYFFTNFLEISVGATYNTQ